MSRYNFLNFSSFLFIYLFNFAEKKKMEEFQPRDLHHVSTFKSFRKVGKENY